MKKCLTARAFCDLSQRWRYIRELVKKKINESEG